MVVKLCTHLSFLSYYRALSCTFFCGKKSTKKSQSKNITPIFRQQHQLSYCTAVNSNFVTLFYTSGKSTVKNSWSSIFLYLHELLSKPYLTARNA